MGDFDNVIEVLSKVIILFLSFFLKNFLLPVSDRFCTILLTGVGLDLYFGAGYILNDEIGWTPIKILFLT